MSPSPFIKANTVKRTSSAGVKASKKVNLKTRQDLQASSTPRSPLPEPGADGFYCV